MSDMRRGRRRTSFQHSPSPRRAPGPRLRSSRASRGHANAAPDWGAVERVLAELARTHAVFPTETSEENWVSAYSPGRRLVVETPDRSASVQVEHLQTCWETFERLGRIRRGDVLEPGRCSALVMALFGLVPGVRGSGDRALVLEGR